ncbi:hypothetical protein EST38_g9003 [Candolleomyces aberdarensis]|uniref:Uncharacterized protein n=1 Tax=Candolleomyces aberdarensis TaxID=2316362 RepID=A0A4Q2DB77_9AGAR|nr:hypothetical protein EST38_g9003 [Candolleomyces aberdarensis]
MSSATLLRAEAAYTELVETNLTNLLKDPHVLTSAPEFLQKLHSNNPRQPAERSRDGADKWFFKNGDLATFKFPATLDRRGRFDKSSAYFNATNRNGEAKLDAKSLRNLKAVFELRPLHDDDHWAYMYPDGAVTSSQQTLAAILLIQGALDEKRGPLPDTQQTRVIRTYNDEDRFVFTLTSESILSEQPEQMIQVASSSAQQLAAETSLSPCRSNPRRIVILLFADYRPSQTEKAAPRLRNMPDPDQLFQEFPTHLNDVVKAPPIFDDHQNLISPSEYDSKLPREGLVIVEACLCTWEIKKGGKTERRVIHLRPLNVQLVPFTPKSAEEGTVPLAQKEDSERRPEKRKSMKASSSRAESTRLAAKRKVLDPQNEGSKPKKVLRSMASSSVTDDDMECDDGKGELEFIEEVDI